MKDQPNSLRPLILLIFLALLVSLVASLPAVIPVQALATPVPEEDEPELPNLPKFGKNVTVLPNGNLVVADPDANAGAVLNVGVVYLYDGTTLKLISTLSGNSREDRVGFGGVVALQNGDFVVLSPDWDRDSGAGVVRNAGAVTWCSGVSGCQGSVSPENSLVGSTNEDRVGEAAMALPSGGFVALSPNWDHVPAGGAVVANAGAATFCAGADCRGPVSADNSLYGSSKGDFIGYAYLESGVILLPDGSVLVRSPFWDNGEALNAGAVTWCPRMDPGTPFGEADCIGPVTAENSLVGSSTYDHVGYYHKSEGITVLPNGSYLVRSPSWDTIEENKLAQNDAGAITFCRGRCSGVVSPANSLTGSSLEDLVGERVEILPNGSYLALNSGWDHGKIVDAGALSWCSADQGCRGVISPQNSLTGSAVEDQVGSGYQVLSNGSFVALSPHWNLGEIPDVGAATWCSGVSTCAGAISPENSLVGRVSRDMVGGSYAPPAGGAVLLPDGSYVVLSPDYDAGEIANVGAITWCPASGCVGFVTPEISLVGRMVGDRVGFQGLTVLANGSYVVLSPYWDTRTAFDAGAVTWCPPENCTGVVTAENSLTGGSTDDRVGYHGIIPLPNSNYVVPSPFWDKPKVVYEAMAIDAGAVTWCRGNLEGEHCAGVVSSELSLTGGSDFDRVGSQRVILLADGSYVVPSPSWDLDWMVDVGALTWCSAISGCQGAISAENSLVGSAVNDRVGGNVQVLQDGGYLALSPDWDRGIAYNAGAVTWCRGAYPALTPVDAGAQGDRNSSGECIGPISPENSLLGSAINDRVGSGVTLLPNGSYVVNSPDWDLGSGARVVKDAGAVTWCAGMSAATKPREDETTADAAEVETEGATEMPHSPGASIGSCIGPVTPENSLVGGQLEDRVGFHLVVLPNGNYVVSSPDWDHANRLDVGAATWCRGEGPETEVKPEQAGQSANIGDCIGLVSAQNSLVGGRSFDRISFGPDGSQMIAFPDGSYSVISPYWGYGAMDKVGAVTWCRAEGPSIVDGVEIKETGNDAEPSPGASYGDCIGQVSAQNSLVGSSRQDMAGSGGLVTLPNRSFVVISPFWDLGGQRDAGAVTWCDPHGEGLCLGTISPENSLVGSLAYDQVGSGGLVVLSNGNYATLSPWWDNGPRVDAGAISVCSGTGPTGLPRDCIGPVTPENSLIGGSGTFIEK